VLDGAVVDGAGAAAMRVIRRGQELPVAFSGAAWQWAVRTPNGQDLVSPANAATVPGIRSQNEDNVAITLAHVLPVADPGQIAPRRVFKSVIC